ncbi:MAG: PspC domain-containing protein [Methanoregulaceae archaeon]|nr:PspC domain-containing protein [Methanoregulaceae archaeon]
MGTYFDTDPNIIRILWVALTILSVGSASSPTSSPGS